MGDPSNDMANRGGMTDASGVASRAVISTVNRNLLIALAGLLAVTFVFVGSNVGKTTSRSRTICRWA